MAESLPERFLAEEVTLEQRWRALHQNTQAYYLRTAQAGTGSHIRTSGNLVWTSNHFCIPSEKSLQDDHVVDEILTWYRSQRPLQGAVWWYLHPGTPLKLGARLFARGVCPNWDPIWMWCDLRQLQKSPLTDPKFTIRTATAEDYLVSDEENNGTVQAISTVVPRRVFHLLAFRESVRLGQCILNLTTGEFGVGALFNLWVVTKERRQGIGAALVQAACELAREMGCNHVTLNATHMGEPVYRRVGFQSMGHGHTWYLNASVVEQPAPTSQQIKFLEAIGLSDIEALDNLRESLKHDQLQNATLNELTPFEIAVRCQQPASASWLLGQGVIPDIISLWDLGWKDRVPALLIKHPELVMRESGRWTATPLHTAIERNDIELAKLLLTVPNDLDAKDAVFRSTPFGWAQHFGRKEILALLKAHTNTDSLSALLESILGKEQIRSDLNSMKTEK